MTLGSWSFARRCEKNRMRGWLDEASDRESARLSGLDGARVRFAGRGGYGGAGWIECRWRLTEPHRPRVTLRSEKRTNPVTPSVIHPLQLNRQTSLAHPDGDRSRQHTVFPTV